MNAFPEADALPNRLSFLSDEILVHLYLLMLARLTLAQASDIGSIHEEGSRHSSWARRERCIFICRQPTLQSLIGVFR